MRLTPEDRRRIERAIAEAERATAGELVVVLAEAADVYRLTALLWPCLLALLTPLPILLLAPRATAGAVYLAQLAVALAGLGLLSIPAVRLLLVPPAAKLERARELAREQFFVRGLHRTRGRTGVLLAVALGERHAEILADDGINGRVDPGTWDGCLDRLLEAARAGRPADGVVAAVEEIGRVLATHVPAGPGDRNELPNRLVLL